VAVVQIGTPCDENRCEAWARYRVRYLTSTVLRPSFVFCPKHAADRVELSEVDVSVVPLGHSERRATGDD